VVWHAPSSGLRDDRAEGSRLGGRPCGNAIDVGYMEMLCICSWRQAEQDDLVDRFFGSQAPGESLVIYMASCPYYLTHRTHTSTANRGCCQALQCIQHAGSAVKVCSHARMHAHPRRPCSRSGAVGEDASRGACVGMGMSWAWEVWRVA
jgi:hypothetical protein